MKVEIIDDKIAIILDPQQIIDRGKEVDVDITRVEATEILKRMFVGHFKDDDIEPFFKDAIESAVHWETDTTDCYWPDDEERESELERKLLTYKALVWEFDTQMFRKRTNADDDLSGPSRLSPEYKVYDYNEKCLTTWKPRDGKASLARNITKELVKQKKRNESKKTN